MSGSVEATTGNCPSDDVVGNSGIFHGSRQMAGHRGEVFTVDAEAFVGLRERAAVVPGCHPAPASPKAPGVA